jgi:hypothetical protein
MFTWFLIFALNIITLCGRIWKKSREVVTYKKELLRCDFLKNAGILKWIIYMLSLKV